MAQSKHIRSDMIEEKHRWLYEEYSQWERTIAKNYTKLQIQREINKCESARESLKAAHLNALNKSSSMTSNSQRRAQSRNSLTGNYERMAAYIGALEIYEYYPEKTKEHIL